MQKILISLISDQTVPNILLIREVPLVDKYYFISTELMEKRRKSNAIIEACNISNDNYEVIKVIEDSISDIEKELDSIKFDDDDEIIVNLTGGTKVMAIAVYNYFRRFGASIHYMPIGKNSYHKLYPESKNKVTQLNYRISLIEYLKGYGVRVSKKGVKAMKTVSLDPEFTEKFLETFLNSNKEDRMVIELLRVDHRGKSIEDVQLIKGLSEFFV